MSISDLIHEQQEILARNGENARKRQNREEIRSQLHQSEERLKQIKEALAEEESKHEKLMGDTLLQTNPLKT